MLKTLIIDKLYFYKNIIEKKHRIVLEQGSLAKCKPSVDNSFLIEEKTSGINRAEDCATKVINHDCFKLHVGLVPPRESMLVPSVVNDYSNSVR